MPQLPPLAAGAALTLVAYVVEALWEGILVAALAAAVIRLFPRANATTRYAIWYLALVAAVVLPVLTVAALALAPHDPHRFAIALPRAATLGLAAAWLIGVAVGLARIGLGYRALAKLQRDALPLPPGYRDAMPLWDESRAHGRETRLCVSPDVTVPVAVGLFDGMIVMPDHLLHSFERDDVDRFSLHEMAHLQRRDDWTCALQRIVCALLFFSPAVRWIARQLDLEREVACDDWVVSQTREVRPYAIGLTKMAEVTRWPHRPVPTPAIFASRKSISIRIERLLTKHRDVRTTLTGGPAVAGAALIAGAALVALPVAPVVGEALAPLAPPFTAHVNPPAPRALPSHRVHQHARVTAVAPRARRNIDTVALTAPPPVASPVVTPSPSASHAPPRVASVAAAHTTMKVQTAKSVHTTMSVRATTTVNTTTTVHTSTNVQTGTAPVALAYDSPRVPSSPRVDLLAALATSGYAKISADEIIALHNAGIDGTFIVAASRYFGRQVAVDSLVGMANVGVSASYLDELGQGNARGISPNDVGALVRSGVSASYVVRMGRMFSAVTVSQIIAFVQHGVPASLPGALRDRGYGTSYDDVIALADHGVPLSYVDALNAHRTSKLSLAEIIKLYDNGVRADGN